MHKNKETSTQVLSLTALITPFLLLPIVGIVTGHVALKEYRNTNIDKSWRPLAIVGLIISYIVLVFKIMGIMFFTGLMLLGAMFSSTTYNTGHHGPPPYVYDYVDPYMPPVMPYVEDELTYTEEMPPYEGDSYGQSETPNMEKPEGEVGTTEDHKPMMKYAY